MTSNDEIVDQAVQHGVAQAEREYPRLVFKLWQRVLLVFCGLLIVANSALNGVLVGELHSTTVCQKAVNVHARVIAADDRNAVDSFIDSLGSYKNLSHNEVASLVKAYDAKRDTNNDARAKTYATDCG